MELLLPFIKCETKSYCVCEQHQFFFVSCWEGVKIFWKIWKTFPIRSGKILSQKLSSTHIHNTLLCLTSRQIIFPAKFSETFIWPLYNLIEWAMYASLCIKPSCNFANIQRDHTFLVGSNYNWNEFIEELCKYINLYKIPVHT